MFHISPVIHAYNTREREEVPPFQYPPNQEIQFVLYIIFRLYLQISHRYKRKNTYPFFSCLFTIYAKYFFVNMYQAHCTIKTVA